MSDKPKRKYERRVTYRDPVPDVRDPVIQAPKRKYCARAFIEEPMPVVCPECGRNTRIKDGSHTDPVRKVVHKYRECIKCGKLLTSVRKMTLSEEEKHCGYADAVRDYEDYKKEN